MMVHLETEGVNPVTIRLLEYEYKVVYTYIKKNKVVSYDELLKRFQKWDIRTILEDLELDYLIWFEKGN